MWSRVYAAFLDDLEQRIKDGQDPKCFARDMTELANKYGFDDAQKYFCGKIGNRQFCLPTRYGNLELTIC